jgi:HAD superfamily hydrolase (TIGR01509 family)
MVISTIVFDFGNVVAQFSHRKAAEQIAAFGSASAASIQAYLFGAKLEDDLESGRIAPQIFIGMVRDTFHLQCTDEQFTRAYVDMFTANAEVCDLLPRLKPRYKLLLLSNTNDLHARHFLAKFREQLAPFEAVVLSHEVGIRKPDPRIYEYCRRKAGSPPASECLFIDDLAANIEGVRHCGWQGIVYRPGENLVQQLAAFGVDAEAKSRLRRNVS